MTTTPSDAGRAAAPEQSGAEGELRRLSSEGTVWWRSIFPTVFTVGVGIAAMGIIMEWWGRSPSPGVKIMLGLAWMAGSILFALFGRSLHDVWLAGDCLIVNGANGRAEIHLEDITGFSETRAQKIKSIKIHLRPGLPLGSSIRFLPPLSLQAPFSEHPVIGEIKERKRRLAGVTGRDQLPG